MNNRIRSIQSVLFITYSLIIVIIFTLLAVLFYIWASDQLKDRANESIHQLSQSMQEKLDLQIQQMDTVSLNILYSNLVKEHFTTMTPKTESSLMGSQERLDFVTNAKELAEILVATNGPALPVQQINLYDFRENVFRSGIQNGWTQVDVKNYPWYESVLRNETGKVITPPQTDDALSRFLSTQDEVYSISLIRLFFGKYDVREGIVEVKKYAGELFKTLDNYKSNSANQEHLIVFNDSGQLIYPLPDKSSENQWYADEFLRQHQNNQITPVYNQETGEKEIYSASRSSYTGWTVAVIVSENKLLEPLKQLTRVLFLVSLTMILLAIFLSYMASKKITRPITKMYNVIRATKLENINMNSQLELNSGIHELDRLQLAFIKMSERLKISMDDLLLAQSQEMQSKMIALHSQMNPHFLYNTLSTISVMAEEEMNAEIVSLIDNLSDMMRYISSDDSMWVELGTELDYTEKYLNCIQYRHGQKLVYSIEVDENLRKIPIPKLVIQPLVENAVKYCGNHLPPWHINIKGTITPDRWCIVVSDNGPGFEPNTLSRIEEKIHEIQATQKIPSLQIKGMGLVNIYVRLRYYYPSSMTFNISNHSKGGAQITIGGALQLEADPYDKK